MIDLSSICPPITTTSFSQPPSTASITQPSLSSQPSSRRQRQESSSRSVLPSTSSTTSRRSRRNTANSVLPSGDQPSSEMSSASPVGPQNTTDVILTRVFQDQTNVLKRDDRELIVEFLNGRLRVNPFDPSTSLHRIILNEAKHKDPLHPTRTTIEQIVFEMNFTSGHWRKLRRKAVVRDAVASERFEEHVSKDEHPGAEWWSGRIPAGWDSNGNKIDSIAAVSATVNTVTKHASVSVASREIYVCGR